MKKLIFISLFLLSSAAFGEWSQIYRDENTRSYVDYSTKINVGNYMRIWRKNIYLKPLVTNVGDISSVNRFDEIDCRERKYRTINYEGYSDILQQKLVQKLTLNGDWNYFSPGTIGSQEIIDICSR